jgi:hypothetical protein
MTSSQTIESSIQQNSNNPVSGGAVYTAIRGIPPSPVYTASLFESLETGWVSPSSFAYWWGHVSYIQFNLMIVPSAIEFTANTHVKIGTLAGIVHLPTGENSFPSTCLWTSQTPRNMVYLVIDQNRDIYIHPTTSFSANPGTYFMGSITIYQMQESFN